MDMNLVDKLRPECPVCGDKKYLTLAPAPEKNTVLEPTPITRADIDEVVRDILQGKYIREDECPPKSTDYISVVPAHKKKVRDGEKMMTCDNCLDESYANKYMHLFHQDGKLPKWACARYPDYSRELSCITDHENKIKDQE